jgi:hypothetical protein
MPEPTAYRSPIVDSIGLIDGPSRAFELTLDRDGTVAFHAEDEAGDAVDLTLDGDELERIHRALGHLLYLRDQL